MSDFICTGCDRPVWEAHKTVAEHIACEGEQQRRVLAELNAANEAQPKKDRRFLARNAPLRKRQK